MLVFILVVSVFPIIVATLLKGRMAKSAVIVSTFNIFAAVIAVLILNQVHPRTGCTQSLSVYKCESAVSHYLIISSVNIIIAAISWYLAFLKKDDNFDAPTRRRLLSSLGWLIVFGTIGFILFVIAAFSAI